MLLPQRQSKTRSLNTRLFISSEDSLIVVDVQNDFCPGGALPVPQGDEIIPILNQYVAKFEKAGAKVFATRDWHPLNHISFKAYGGPWPAHCVQGTRGAEFHQSLKLPEKVTVISKATDPMRESYSGFDGTDLEVKMRELKIRRNFVGGLATDYCVKRTVLDGLRIGFSTFLLTDAIRGIEQKAGDSEEAIREMIQNGAKTITLSDISD